MIKAVAASVDDLLDREQRDQHPAQRNRRIERGNRRVRRQPEAAEPAQEIDVTEIDEAAGDGEDHGADPDLDEEARRPVYRLGNRREIEMIVAPGGDRRPDENTVDEQGRRDLLQPQPGMAERSRQDVERDRKRKA